MPQKRPAAVAVPIPTDPPGSHEQQRRPHLLSDAFADRLTAHLERAAQRAVRAHRDAGLPVHGIVDGRLVEVRPPDPEP